MTTSPVGRKKITFQIQAEPGSTIYVAGNFNEWSPIKNKLKERNGIYSATLLLPRGRHEYKFVADGNWRHDPRAHVNVWNPNGTLNSVAQVQA